MREMDGKWPCKWYTPLSDTQGATAPWWNGSHDDHMGILEPVSLFLPESAAIYSKAPYFLYYIYILYISYFYIFLNYIVVPCLIIILSQHFLPDEVVPPPRP